MSSTSFPQKAAIDFEASRRKVSALVAPGNVVIVGATDRPGSWGALVARNLQEFGFPGRVFYINPKRDELFGQPCYKDFAALPEPPDHMAILVPGHSVPEIIRQGAAAGARSATVFSAGFGEGEDTDSGDLKHALEAAIAETGIGVSGPNCMGNVVAASHMVTMTTAPRGIEPGPVALIGQSGGILLFLNRVLWERGIHTSHVITSGNELGLSAADYIAYFTDDPAVKVIFCYVEALRDPESFKAACQRAAEAGKPVIVFKAGQSEAGRKAAMAHTGSLAGRAEVFNAIAGECGVISVENLDQGVELIEFLLHTKTPKGRRLAALTVSGAFRAILLDAAEQAGLHFPELAPETRARLDSLLQVGSNIGNPLDGGFSALTSPETYAACLAALDADPNIDCLLVQDEIRRLPEEVRGSSTHLIDDFAARLATKPVVCVSLLSHSQSDFSRTLRRNEVPSVAFLNSPNKAMTVIAQAIRRREMMELAGSSPDVGPVPPLELQPGDGMLDEQRSKAVIEAFGIPTPTEAKVTSADDAVRAAREIGYPVVLKLVSSTIAHKSDIGGVALDLADDDAVRQAYRRIHDNAATHGVAGQIEGALVAPMIKGGVEVALGLHRDPEMGIGVMVASGGVLLEIIRDAAFAGAPITRQKARDMIGRTRVGTLLTGYRGAAAADVDALIDAIVALGRLAHEYGDAIEAIDINPLVVLPAGKGVLALDALVVCRSV
jgi:acetate---CoA ligase (ADP-forming)